MKRIDMNDRSYITGSSSHTLKGLDVLDSILFISIFDNSCYVVAVCFVFCFGWPTEFTRPSCVLTFFVQMSVVLCFERLFSFSSVLNLSNIIGKIDDPFRSIISSLALGHEKENNHRGLEEKQSTGNVPSSVPAGVVTHWGQRTIHDRQEEMDPTGYPS